MPLNICTVSRDQSPSQRLNFNAIFLLLLCCWLYKPVFFLACVKRCWLFWICVEVQTFSFFISLESSVCVRPVKKSLEGVWATHLPDSREVNACLSEFIFEFGIFPSLNAGNVACRWARAACRYHQLPPGPLISRLDDIKMSFFSQRSAQEFWSLLRAG